jgi:hypothetical protein
MSSDIGSLSDGIEDSEGKITNAKARVADEQTVINEFETATRRFCKRVRGIDARFGGTAPTGSTPEDVLHRQSIKSKECLAVLKAYKETAGRLATAPLETNQDILYELAVEFSQELAGMLVTAIDQNSFPPALKAAVVSQAEDRISRYESAQQALEVEHASLQDIEQIIKETQADIELCRDSLDEHVDIHWIAEMYTKLERHEEVLNDTATSRQKLLHSKTGSKHYTINHWRLADELYREFASNHPGLNAIIETAQQIEEIRPRISDRLDSFH